MMSTAYILIKLQCYRCDNNKSYYKKSRFNMLDTVPAMELSTSSYFGITHLVKYSTKNLYTF